MANFLFLSYGNVVILSLASQRSVENWLGAGSGGLGVGGGWGGDLNNYGGENGKCILLTKFLGCAYFGANNKWPSKVKSFPLQGRLVGGKLTLITSHNVRLTLTTGPKVRDGKPRST